MFEFEIDEKLEGIKVFVKKIKKKGLQMVEYGFKMIHLKGMMYLYLNLCVCLRLNKHNNGRAQTKKLNDTFKKFIWYHISTSSINAF